MKLNVSVIYPNHGQISYITKKSVLDLVKSKIADISLKITQGSNLPFARNNAINYGKSSELYQKLEGFDYMLMLDSDMGFIPEDIKKLIDHDKEIVSVAYQRRENLDILCAGYWKKDVDGVDDIENRISWSEKGLKKVDWVGAGCLLIKKEALEKMEFPWFRAELIKFKNDNKEVQVITSDDFGFCHNAKKHGLDVYVDCSCKIEHLSMNTNTIVSDLPLDTRKNIVEEELKKLEMDIYRVALKAEAVKNSPGVTDDSSNRLEALKSLKSVYLKEMEKLQKMNVHSF